MSDSGSESPRCSKCGRELEDSEELSSEDCESCLCESCRSCS